MTDNRIRTVADVRHIFSKHNGSLGVNGSVAFLFDRKGLIAFSTDQDFDAIFEAALEAGAEDVKDEGDAYEVLTDPADFIEVREALAATGLKWETAEITMLPQTMVKLEGKQAEQMLKLMDKLEDNDDVQNVFANFDISDEEIEKVMG
jgi:YebC/PmpR family DNA-binding regulatory protein